jgi:hypothetical protein
MTVPVFTEHARTRAIERYKLILTDADLIAIHTACTSGRAPAMSKDSDGAVHIFTWHGHRVYPLISIKTKRLVTFMPLDYFAPGQRGAFAAKKLGKFPKQVPRAGKAAERRHERRDTPKRAIEKAMGDE